MKVLMIVRNNFYELGGGDKIQVLKTKEELEKLGHNVTIAIAYPRSINKYDIIHLFNMMLAPHAYLIHTLRAQAAGIPVALSTIYWNPSEWLEHTSKEGFPMQVNASEQQSRFVGIPRWHVVYSILRYRPMWMWVWLSIWRRGQGKASAYVRRTLVSHVDIILPNGQSEADAVQQDFATARRVAVIPNGVDDMFSKASKTDFVSKYHIEGFVLHVGRIETRKNLIALVSAVNKLKLPLVLIGNGTHDPVYTAAVKKVAGPNALFIEELEHHQLGAAYKAAKVHALASWFETPGLSSLEAGLAGCNVVSTDRGTTKEYFMDMAWYCDPADIESIKAAVRGAYDSKPSHRLRNHLLKHYTWDKVAAATEAAYHTITIKSSET